MNRNTRPHQGHCAVRLFVPFGWLTGGGHSWESCASRLLVIFVLRLIPSTTRIPSTLSELPKERVIWSGGGPQGVRHRQKARSRKRRLQRWRCAETSQVSKRRISWIPG